MCFLLGNRGDGVVTPVISDGVLVAGRSTVNEIGNLIGVPAFRLYSLGAQHIPGGPTAPDRRVFVIGEESSAHRITSYVNRAQSIGLTVG